MQVSPVPDVYVYDLHKTKEQFIILASDGLWNMIQPQEAVSIVGDIETKKSKQVKELVLECLVYYTYYFSFCYPYIW